MPASGNHDTTVISSPRTASPRDVRKNAIRGIAHRAALDRSAIANAEGGCAQPSGPAAPAAPRVTEPGSGRPAGRVKDTPTQMPSGVARASRIVCSIVSYLPAGCGRRRLSPGRCQSADTGKPATRAPLGSARRFQWRSQERPPGSGTWSSSSFSRLTVIQSGTARWFGISSAA